MTSSEQDTAPTEYEHTVPRDEATVVAEFAKAYEIGDEIHFEAPPDHRVLSAEVVGFSTRVGLRGLPVIATPDELLEFYDGTPETIAIQEDRHVDPEEVTNGA